MKKRYILLALPLMALTSCKISGNSTVQYAYEKTQSSTDFNLNIVVENIRDNNTYTQKYEYTMKDSVIHFKEDSKFYNGTSETRDVYQVNGISYEIKDNKYEETSCTFISQVDCLGDILSNYYISLKTMQLDMNFNEDLLMYELNKESEYSTINDKKYVISKMLIKIDEQYVTSSTAEASGTTEVSTTGKISYAKVVVDTYSSDSSLLWETKYQININYGISLELPEELNN